MDDGDRRTAQRSPLASRERHLSGKHPLWQTPQLPRQLPLYLSCREQMNRPLTRQEACDDLMHKMCGLKAQHP